MHKLELPTCIAHRGTRVLAPENTLAAFSIAHQLGATWIECDLQLSRDGEVFVFHDATLERTSNGVGCLSEWESDKLTKLDAGSWFSSDFIGERIPTLAQLLLFAKVSHMGLNLELKPTRTGAENLVVKVIEAIAMGAFPTERLLLSSFALPILTLLRHYDSELSIGVLYDTWDPSWQKSADCLRASAIICQHKILTEKRIDAIHQAGFQALAYTVNQPKRYKTLRAWGVDAVFVDDPRNGFQWC